MICTSSFVATSSILIFFHKFQGFFSVLVVCLFVWLFVMSLLCRCCAVVVTLLRRCCTVVVTHLLLWCCCCAPVVLRSVMCIVASSLVSISVVHISYQKTYFILTFDKCIINKKHRYCCHLASNMALGENPKFIWTQNGFL